MSEKLLPCPFCGDFDAECAESAVPNVHGGQKYAVFCNACFCEGPTDDIRERAIAAWNRRELESASQPGGGEADGERFRSILAAVVGEIQKDDGRYDGNAPGHAHDIPGVWDNDNGAKSGKPCSWCRTWKLARESLGLAAPSAGNGGAEGDDN